MKGLFIGLIVEFIKATATQAREALERRKARKKKEALEKKQKALEAKRRKLREQQKEAKRLYDEKQRLLKIELEAARVAFKEHWKETRPEAKPLDDNPYDEE